MRRLGVALLVAVLAQAPPPCETYAATDGHEPLCNPWVGESPWSVGHRNPYSTHTSPVAGPRPGEPVTATFHTFDYQPQPGVTLGAFFSPRYADGKRIAWSLVVNGTNDNPISKHDVATGRIIDTFQHTTRESTPPDERAALSGIYVLLGRNGDLYQPRGKQIEVYSDGRNRLGPIRSIKKFVLPDRAK